MKTRAKNNRILAILATVFLAVFALFSPIQAIARAEDAASVQNLDNTKVDADIKDITAAQMAVIQARNSVQLIRFQEYCYSEDYPIYEAYYGLYVYVYTPEGNLATEYNQNKVNMAVADIGTSTPDYENVPLQYLGASEVYKDKIHKFKVLFTAKEKNAFLEEVRKYANAHEGVRRYDVVSFQLVHKDGTTSDTSDLTINDRLFSKTLYFSGYGTGMSEETSGEGASSTLACRYDELETLEIDVKHTNYRALNTLGDSGTCDSLDTVYFNIPERYFTDYGRLQKIEAEWYEYKTKPIFVTSDEGAYNALKSYIGKNIGERNESLPWRVLWEEGVEDEIFCFKKAYNALKGFPLTILETMGGVQYAYADDYQYYSSAHWLFFRQGVKSNADYKVSAEEVLEWAQSYAKTYGTSGYINGKYAQELFEDSIDTDRVQYLQNPSAKRGYMKVTVDADAAEDKVNLLDKQEQSFWDKFWKGTKKPYTNTYDPIVVITEVDIDGLDSESFANKYLISKTDASIVFNACKEAIKNGNRFVLFRFALTDYYASSARFDYRGEDDKEVSDRDGYVAQETVFMDFDVISLSFRSADGQTDTVIGVCADPIDIFNGLDPTPGLGDKNNTLAAIISAIIIALIVIVGIFVVIMLANGGGPLLLTITGAAARGIGEGLKIIGGGIKFVAVSIKDGFEAMFQSKNK